jgi:hypothetical protein
MKRVLVLTLAIAGCGDPKFSKTWGSLESTVRGATAVEAQLLDNPYDSEMDRSKIEYDWWKWKVKGKPVVVDAATAKQLADALLDEKSYYRGPPKACMPMPGVRVQFVKGAQTVVVLFCLECSMIFVRGADHLGGDDYDPAKSGIVAAMKKIFPNNAAIQAYK